MTDHPKNGSTAAHHVVVIGAGFGGLQTVRSLKGAGVRITLIDQRNHHLFQPLLYQVATTILSPSEIAWPVRDLMEHRHDVTTLLGTVTGIRDGQVLLSEGEAVPYDTLVIATGSRHSYFGNDQWSEFAPGLKSLEDATLIRRRILLAFEHAEREADRARRAAHLTFAIVGGGPTGVELAGIIAELAQKLRPQFRNIDTSASRILLIEAGERLLAAFDPSLSDYAATSLTRRGVELSFGKAVTDCRDDGILLGGEFLPCQTRIWAAGVAASPAADWLGLKGDRAGRVPVQNDLTVEGHPEIFVIGDTATVPAWEGKPVPGVAPAAKQQGSYVAKVIRARHAGQTPPPDFTYRHLGDLATIGKRSAVIQFGKLRLRGQLAWWFWGITHIYFLIGARSRAAVAWNWFWSHVRGRSAVRLITHSARGTDKDHISE
ncbi:NAD(P)/FAD-dependent oxidoreductase [Falsigemmobacter faecalis]|uniref:NADH:ubiquinone reductase (non-electrogenic) n=1 Tax=Falsigemmobacter faecalis TaxID=2488730 RepID=A0A3P3DEW0_9RHOB|nr:NAD(P)/FAD-dependent oxidoreductase [Falsigemmobacter faecalis]RRH72817.1 NAD(P)/FAD-dependent oxidoreductase [Falsigemmobacter faecalis]